MFRSAAVLTLLSGVAFADDKRCLDVQFTPSDNLQIVAWVTDTDGVYQDTVFITQQTGTFGLGNRPGRFDFNSGPNWPYGRRLTTFPVWAHANGQAFPYVIFQNDTSDDPNACFAMSGNYPQCGENDLSHPAAQSSNELHFCRPMTPEDNGWDVGSCPTRVVGTDKGRFSTFAETTGYPPRADQGGTAQGDSPSVAMYKAMNPFDAVSQPTPPAGTLNHAPWLVPTTLPAGNYILYVETSKERDFNDTYNMTSYPSPIGLFWSDYGQPFRGQPSVIYRVPFTISDTDTTNASATDYAGYGDPDGADGMIRSPDATITTDTPASGGSRLELVPDGSAMYRVKVSVTANAGDVVPDAPAELQTTDINSNGIALSFVAPGEGSGSPQQRVAGYEVRIRASTEMNEANFDDSMPVTSKVTVDDPGHLEAFDVTSLLPQTDYWIGVRAYDGCHNVGPLAITKVTTLQVVSGSVDACFVATAAYGSMMANDVELLRSFRDTALESTALGELGVETYYTFGPALAGVIGQSDLLRTSARDALRPLVESIRRAGY
jgi:hypothetical protein